MADVEIDTNVKDFTNRNNFGIIVCTSGTRPNAVDGKTIYETDTDKLLIYDGAAWAEITGGGVTDHGALTGLTDDDHTQYVLVNGTRAMTGDLTINKTNPYLYIKPTDATSPAVLLKDSADNIKGRMYTTGDDMVVRPDDGHLYLSTTVTTGGNVLLETKGVTRLTVADALITSTVDMDINDTEIKSDRVEINAGGSGNRYAYLDLHGDDTWTDYGFRIIRYNVGVNSDSKLTHRGSGALVIESIEAADIQLRTANVTRLTIESDGDINANSNKIIGLAAATANGEAVRYEQLTGAYLPLTGGTMSGNIVMGDNDITGANEIQATASQNLTFKVSTGSSIVFQAV